VASQQLNGRTTLTRPDDADPAGAGAQPRAGTAILPRAAPAPLGPSSLHAEALARLEPDLILTQDLRRVTDQRSAILGKATRILAVMRYGYDPLACPGSRPAKASQDARLSWRLR